jgi:hypothetical protein
MTYGLTRTLPRLREVTAVSSAPRRRGRLLLVAAAVMLAVACASSPAAPSGNSGDGTLFQAEVALCISETNRLRATAGKPALTRSPALDSYAAAAAQTDGLARTPHQHSNATNRGNGLVTAENELLYWNLSHYKTVHNIVVQGLAQMWGQGVGGPHYENMAGNYSQIGCGVFVQGDDVSVVQAFR